MKFYTSVFPHSRVKEERRYPPGAPHDMGCRLMSCTFELEGQEFIALNAGPVFRFNEAISFFVRCETQEEVDHYWSALTAGGGQESQCGWLKDQYGLSWQIVPNALGELMGSSDSAAAARVMQAMLQMKKIDIAQLRAAYAG